jgi:CheY-like chemotaxis protein
MNETVVLLVEDNEDDVVFFQRAVTKSSFPYRVQVARTGLEAINYMSGEGEFANREKFPFTKFIMTDSRMPLVSGKEFLQWLKNHPQYSVVPIVLLGGSGNPSDVEHAYEELGVHAYIVKPTSYEKFERIIKLIFDFWAVCEVPLWKLKREARDLARSSTVAHGE